VIRAHALSNYSLEAVALKYDEYFRRLMTLWGEGWYSRERYRDDLVVSGDGPGVGVGNRHCA
jgi:hypothetical protein